MSRRDRSYTEPFQSLAVLWWQLINEMEAFTAATGMGLAWGWGAVHAGDYSAARARLDELKALNLPTTPDRRYRLTAEVVTDEVMTDLGHAATLDAAVARFRHEADHLSRIHGPWRGDFDGCLFENGSHVVTLTVRFRDGLAVPFAAILDEVDA